MYCLICPFSKTFDEVWVTYSVPDFLTSEVKVWQIVEITIREKTQFWIILEISDKLNIDFDESKIKPIVSKMFNYFFVFRIESVFKSFSSLVFMLI